MVPDEAEKLLILEDHVNFSVTKKMLNPRINIRS